MLNLWYKAHLFSPDASTCHPYISSTSFFRNVFSLVHVPFFFVDMKYQNGLNHRRRMRPLFQLMCGSPEVFQTEEKSRPNVLFGHTSLQV